MFNISSEFVHALISQLVTQRKGQCNNRGWYLDFEKGKCLGGILDWVQLWPFIFLLCVEVLILLPSK